MRAGRLRSGVLIGSLVASALVPMLMPAESLALTKGDLVVADARAFGGGALIEVNPETGAESVISSNALPVNATNQLFDLPFTLAISQAGEIFVANTGNLGGSCKGGCGGVIEVDPTSGAESVLSSNAMTVNASSQYFRELTGIAIEPDGNILVTNWGGTLGDAEVIRVDALTGKETLVASNSMPVNASSQYFAYPQGLVTNAAGEIFVADPMAFGEHGGGVIEVNPSTGKESEISANSMPVNASSQYFHSASQLAFDAAGNLLVADWCSAKLGCGGVIEVSPQTGKETQVSANTLSVNLESQLFSESTAVTVDNSGAIVETQEAGLGGSCEHGCGGLVSVNPTTGKETELSANSLAVNSHSEFFVEPFEVAVYGPTFSGSSPGGAGAPGGGQGSQQPPTQYPTLSPRATLKISGVAQSRSRWHEHSRRRPRHRSARVPAGTVFSFTLNEAAYVKLEFARVSHGRSVHGVCAATSARNRHKRACTYTVPAGVLTVAGHSGKNTLAFAGLLSRRRALRSGSYRLTVTAVNTAGKAVAVRALRFVVLA